MFHYCNCGSHKLSRTLSTYRIGQAHFYFGAASITISHPHLILPNPLSRNIHQSHRKTRITQYMQSSPHPASCPTILYKVPFYIYLRVRLCEPPPRASLGEHPHRTRPIFLASASGLETLNFSSFRIFPGVVFPWGRMGRNYGTAVPEMLRVMHPQFIIHGERDIQGL